MSDPAVVTCALTGVLTDPVRYPVPVTPEQMASAAREAWDAGATVVHCHFRSQEPGHGAFPSWDPAVAGAIVEAIRAEVPRMLINCSTGILGRDQSGPLAVLERVRPDTAALNAGTLNYLKARRGGTWAWPPMVFDNPVEKIQEMLAAMERWGVVPECECFDTGILRSIGLFRQVGLLKPDAYNVSLVMGVASGMPAKASWLPLLLEEMPEDARRRWQVIVIGRAEVWDVHRRAVELGGHVRTGLEDTFYLPDGTKTGSNGALIDALVATVRAAGREPATDVEARALFGLPAAQ